MGFNPLKLGAKIIKWGAPAALAPLTGGASLAAYSLYGQQAANAKNVALTREQMEFQERMRDTEVQARVKDLIAAGLNPALAYEQSASSPSGNAATVENVAGGMASTAINAATAKANIANLRATNENIRADTAIKIAEARGRNLDNLLKEVDTSATSLQARQDIRWAEKHKIEKEVLNIIENTNLTSLQRDQLNRIINFVTDEKAAQAKLAQLGIAEAEANEQLWATVEGWGKGAGLGAKILEGLKNIIIRPKAMNIYNTRGPR